MIGQYNGATGTAAVDGSGSKWTSTSNLDVGNYGSGTLEISGGGAVLAASVAIDGMGMQPSVAGDRRWPRKFAHRQRRQRDDNE